MNSSGGGRRQEAERWLGVAEKLLEARDFEGCKQFVEQAVSADPLVPGAEEIVAAAEVLQSVQIRRIKAHPDYYSILGLDSSLPSSLDPAAVSLHYHRLSLLLHRDNLTPAFSDAARLVQDAWAILSNPSSKSLFDKELQLELSKPKTPPPPPPPKPQSLPKSKSAPSKPPKSPKSKPPKSSPKPKPSKKDSNFWTMCSTCFHVHLYGRLCEGQYLLCHSCHRPFLATVMNEPPVIVPDSDMYYCSWGFFPLGFPGLGPGPISVPVSPVGTQPGGENGTPLTETVKRGPGRPKKSKTTPGTSPGTGPASEKVKVTIPVVGTPITEPVRRGRGRPPKIEKTGTPVSPVPVQVPVQVTIPVQVPAQVTGTMSSDSVRRGRGRPRKSESEKSEKMVAKKRANAKTMIDIN